MIIEWKTESDQASLTLYLHHQICSPTPVVLSSLAKEINGCH